MFAGRASVALTQHDEVVCITARLVAGAMLSATSDSEGEDVRAQIAENIRNLSNIGPEDGISAASVNIIKLTMARIADMVARVNLALAPSLVPTAVVSDARKGENVAMPHSDQIRGLRTEIEQIEFRLSRNVDPADILAKLREICEW